MRIQAGEDDRSATWLGRMRVSLARLLGAQLAVERLMAAAVLVSLLYVARQYVVSGHLPRPFHSDPSQSLMDLYNTAYWSNRPGAYKIWHTVYPPISFIFSRVITKHICYTHTALDARACDPAAAWFVFAFYIINIALVFFSIRRSQIAPAVPRTLALCLGLPMLYGLELANLIIPCFTFFVLAEGELLRPAWARQLCRGLALNFKLYLLVIALPRAVQFRIRWIICLSASCLVIYIITLAIYRSGTPIEIINDLIFYSHVQSSIFIKENHILDISTRSNDVWNRIIPTIIRSGEFFALAGILSSLATRRALNTRPILALSLSLICSEAAIHTQGFSADYTQIFLLYIIFLEKRWSIPHAIVITAAYALCISGDFTLIHAYSESKLSFLSGNIVSVNFDLNLSQFTRPILLFLIQCGLAYMIFRENTLPQTLPLEQSTLVRRLGV